MIFGNAVRTMDQSLLPSRFKATTGLPKAVAGRAHQRENDNDDENERAKQRPKIET
jgi:hypothetical protein